MPQVSQEPKDMLNRAIAREIQVSVQYVWQHVVWRGIRGFSVKGELRAISVAEMKHAEAIAERLFYLGEPPTTRPGLEEQLRRDLADEEGAIELYKAIIAKAGDEGDIVRQDLFKAILADEEEHHDTFQGLLEEL